jgi:hypothetical protein
MGRTKTTRTKRNEEEEILIRIEEYKKRQTFSVLETPPKRFRFISFDVETTSRNNDFYICGIIDENNKYKCYYDKEEVIEYFRTIKDNDIMIFATNLEFDYSTIFKESKIINDCEFIVNGGRFIMVVLNGTYGKVKFYDTLNYGGFSVETMGKILGLPKLVHPKCLGKKPKNKKEQEELITYNKRDCEVSREFMIMIQDALNNEGGELKSTVSSCALDIYRRKFMPFNMIREDIAAGIHVKDKVYKAYYGGRTEAFKRGLIKDYNYYDCNSLYPFVMLNNLPIPQSVHFQSEEMRKLLKYEGVSFFKLEIPYTKYPLLPYRLDDKLVFPIGRFSGYYTHLEIRRAIQLYGKQILIEMKDTVFYMDTFPLFKKYVEFMYEKRLECKNENSSKEIFYKLMMNSLYGRFSMKVLSNTDFFIPENDEQIVNVIKKNTDKVVLNMNIGGLSYTTEEKIYDGVSSMPILSCYVTAYSRILMHSYVLETEPVYMDTDSIFTKKKVATGKKLGELKLEETITEGIIIKPKSYFINQKVKFKGLKIPKDQKHLIRLKKNILSGKTARYEKFVKMKEGLKRNLRINSIEIIEKNVDLEDTKRDWKNKKFSPYELQDSEPLEIKEW